MVSIMQAARFDRPSSPFPSSFGLRSKCSLKRTKNAKNEVPFTTAGLRQHTISGGAREPPLGPAVRSAAE